jgi:argininosuccinate lyase
VPFREAHGIVAGLVRHALDSGRTLSQLSDGELTSYSDKLDPAGFRQLLEAGSWLESKVSEGGTASARVTEQLAAARSALASPS